MITLIQNANRYLDKTAIKCEKGSYSYNDLLRISEEIALDLLDGRDHLNEARVAFLVTPGIDYVTVQWGIWRAGGIAVPICTKHPIAAIEYVLIDTDSSYLVYSKELAPAINTLNKEDGPTLKCVDSFKAKPGVLPDVAPTQRAMIVYTSGTTGNPKGVVTTHEIIASQITTLTSAWKWSSSDHVLNVLPMHHVHGIVNILGCALWSGACCQFMSQFESEKVYEAFIGNTVNVFMAVPTIYYKLINYWKNLPVEKQELIKDALTKFRLMVSGSAALPESIMKTWGEISGHDLLERYGMTEIGMAISNPYKGERRPGHIGQPLENVQVRLVDDEGNVLIEGPGEIQIKGPNVFKEYWNKPEATKEAFTEDGWFKTGDIAMMQKGSFKILGRNSIDIIKSGGYKISALEIEEVLRKHESIKDCAVVGIPDDEWGEVVCASLILSSGSLELVKLSNWLAERLPSYKVPRKYIFQDDLPKNVMGKVTKHELKQHFMD